ncbi:MAG: glutamyl-Q tRNA(Asp) synthetase [Sphingomonas bacterium]
MSEIVTRFAPSPTGLLHIGHAWSAILAHDRAREAGGCFLLRIEDIDGTRSRPEFIAAIHRDLEWLGLSWDGLVLLQSERLRFYAEALERLKAMGLLYPCFCTRAEIAASLSAPHGDAGPVYPGTCRHLDSDERSRRMADEQHAWRLDMARAIAAAPTPPFSSPAKAGTQLGDADDRALRAITEAFPTGPRPSPGKGERLIWHDEIAGDVIATPEIHGDVILARKDAPASYHLAVTIDDAAQGITHIVRGRDLFAATHVHRLLQALLDLSTPIYRHHALLADETGERLAKRNKAPTLESMREAGVNAITLANDLRNGRLPIGFRLLEA